MNSNNFILICQLLAGEFRIFTDFFNQPQQFFFVKTIRNLLFLYKKGAGIIYPKSKSKSQNDLPILNPTLAWPSKYL